MESYSIYSFVSHTLFFCLLLLISVSILFCWVVSVVWICKICFSIHLLMNLDYFQFVASVIKAAVNICVQSLCRHRFHFFWVHVYEWDCWLICKVCIERHKKLPVFQLGWTTPTSREWEFQLLYILYLVFGNINPFSCVSILLGVKW